MNQDILKQIELLLQPTDDEAWWYRKVKTLDDELAVPYLIEILLDQNETLLRRKTASTILGILGNETAVEPLCQMMNDADTTLRGRAAKALGGFGTLEGPPLQQLIQGLDDEASYVRRSSAKALEKLNCAEALPKLKEMSESDKELTNQEVARKAIRALEDSP
ncbi:MAG: HEAT repeat domain-containing protein [Chloroflexota bacterium]|nr:MAG: HEAT repeat domain-containing protein [Chloroflexota bacterium]